MREDRHPSVVLVQRSGNVGREEAPFLVPLLIRGGEGRGWDRWSDEGEGKILAGNSGFSFASKMEGKSSRNPGWKVC